MTPESPTAKPAEAATLPDVVGMNHQRAQDTMQAAGFYALREVDASGQGRALVWDRNWVVVSQSPEGGADVPVDTVVTLNSKKADE
ncbi:PASTA domain-containing protein [Amycolatopsis marina]|uniref:PASTA domain-containing protein n=1 Tax=Amycolatopsis marina TaxID=490629 RepID=UPI001FE95AD5|nr:PASTA domain-containing protein [Amycolatopsis marina]